jgi:hypothetical protein
MDWIHLARNMVQWRTAERLLAFQEGLWKNLVCC